MRPEIQQMLDRADVADGQRRIGVRVGRDIAVDRAIDMAAAIEMQVAVDLAVGPDERLDDRVPAILLSEHLVLQKVGR